MKSLSDFEPEELASLANEEFHEAVQSEAKSLIGDAFSTYQEVMHGSDDDNARVKAADRIVALAGVEEKRNSLPNGVSLEVFQLALAGLGQLAGIASSSTLTREVLRNVTPAKADPSKNQLLDMPPALPDPDVMSEGDNDDVVRSIANERFEIIQRK